MLKVFCQSNERVYTLLLQKVENIEVKNNTAVNQDVRKGTLITLQEVLVFENRIVSTVFF